jgi:hypothetical protein
MEVLDDTEGAQANLADKGKPSASNLVFKYLIIQLFMDACAFKFRTCMEP